MISGSQIFLIYSVSLSSLETIRIDLCWPFTGVLQLVIQSFMLLLFARTLPSSTGSDGTCCCRCWRSTRSSSASTPTQGAASESARSTERWSPSRRSRSSRDQQSYPNYQPTWQDVLTSSSKTRFSLAASIPWLISSTQRKGTVVNCWRASMYNAVATLLSPPDYGSSCLVSLPKYFVILYLVVGSQPLQGLPVPVLHHDVHTIVFEVILKLALVQDHLKNDKRS